MIYEYEDNSPFNDDTIIDSLNVQPIQSSTPPPTPPSTPHISSYTIKTEFTSNTVYYSINNTLRRYSDFLSFRLYLTRFYPYLFIPPLPEKHSFSRVLRNPLSYTSDNQIIARRIRLLNYFLDRILANKTLANSKITTKFLDPLITNWQTALNEPPFTDLAAHSPLLRLTKDPTRLSPYFTAFPLPKNPIPTTKTTTPNPTFHALHRTATIIYSLSKALESHSKHLSHSFTTLHEQMATLGATLNIFALNESTPHQTTLSQGLESFGNRIDLTFLNIERLTSTINNTTTEPLTTIKNSARICLAMLRFRALRETQLVMLKHATLQAQSTLHSQLVHCNTLSQESLQLWERIVHVLLPGYNELKLDLAFLSLNVEREVRLELQKLLHLLLNVLVQWVECGYVQYAKGCKSVWCRSTATTTA